MQGFRPSELRTLADAVALARPGAATTADRPAADERGFADALLWAECARGAGAQAHAGGEQRDECDERAVAEERERGDGARGAETALGRAAGSAGVLELGSSEGRLDPQAARQLVRYLWDAHRRGQRALELRLRPEGLGRLALRLEVRGCNVYLAAVAEKPEVVRLLIVGQRELAAALARWGLVLRSLEAHSEGSRPRSSESSRTSADDGRTVGDETGRASDAPHLPAAERRSFFEVVA
jgi:hypothetical protein